MIVFDLDGTIADCEHRRNFVDPSKRDDVRFIYDDMEDLCQCFALKGHYYYKDRFKMCEPSEPIRFIPDWKAFYEACDQDKPIEPVCELFDDLAVNNEIEIWSGRCESVREKTYTWLYDNIPFSGQVLRMRPIGDYTPDDILKEKWLDEAISQGKKIDFVFDDRKKVCDMWRRRGIFVFDVNQTGKEF